MGPYLDQINHAEVALDLTPIQRFYHGTSIFITGSTGFLGQLLIEKLLRSCPTISTIYLLVRDKKGKNLDQRLDEMFDDVVFSRLKEECPKFREKVVGIAGDCKLPGLGMSETDKTFLTNKINIIFHVAATVNFKEPLKTAVDINLRSIRDLARWSREMLKLKSFIHISTFYSNCNQNYIEEKLYPPALDGHKLILSTECLPEKVINDMTPLLLGDYPNTYVYTKQIAEDMLQQESKNMPVGIFRPAIVVSTYKEPLENWINNIYGPTGIVAGAGIGLLRTLHCNPKVNANLVPADMCISSIITSAWEVAVEFQEAAKKKLSYEMPVYNYGSTNEQPINWERFMHLSHKFGIQQPSIRSVWYYSFNLYKHYSVYLFFTFLYHTLPALLVDTVLYCVGKKPRLMKAYKKIQEFSEVIAFFSTKEWRISSDRVRKQKENLSERDSAIFFSDLRKLDWVEFFQTYCLGIREYILKDPIETIDVAKVKWSRFCVAHQILKCVSGLTVLWFCYSMIKLCMALII